MKISAQPAVVSVYLDGKATLIERQVLRGVDQFERAQKQNPELRVVIDGQRRSRLAELGRFAGLTVAPMGLSVGVGVALAAVDPLLGATIGGMMLLGLGGTGWKNLALAFTAPRWQSGTRYTVGQGCAPTPVPEAGPERLAELIRSNQDPSRRHVVYISGHGDGKKLVNIPVEQLPHSLPSVDLTVLDACKCAQIEVLSHLAPWSKNLISSAHTVPGRGFPIEKIMAHRDNPLEAASAAAPAATSLSLVSGEHLTDGLLPSLGRLGESLRGELQAGNRREIRAALADSRNPDWFGSRVNLADFLEHLSERKLSEKTHEQLNTAIRELEETVLYSKNDFSLSFDLRRGREVEALPEGWREFLTELDYRWKPIW